MRDDSEEIGNGDVAADEDFRAPGPLRVGTLHPRPTGTPFRLVSSAGLLSSLSGRSGSEPSSEAPEFIACQTCLAESNDSRLQPHVAAHLPGTII